MRVTVFLTMMLFFALLVLSCEEGSQPTQFNANDEGLAANTEIQSLSKQDLKTLEDLDFQFCETIANKDLDGIMSCYWNSPEVILVDPFGNLIMGWENIRQSTQGMFDAHESLKLEILEVTHTRLAGGSVQVVGIAAWEMIPYEGPTVKFLERWTDFRRKVNGKWVATLNHAHFLGPIE